MFCSDLPLCPLNCIALTDSMYQTAGIREVPLYTYITVSPLHADGLADVITTTY